MVYAVKQLEEFSDWLKGLKDALTRQRLIKRLRKDQLGNLGDVEPVGEGVFEMREHFGPGWRMYYVQHGELVIVCWAAVKSPPSRPTFGEPLRWQSLWRIDHVQES